MKKALRSSLGVAVVAGLAVWILEGSGMATHVDPNEGYSDSNYTGAANDRIDDNTPTRGGYDRNQDRIPDSAPDRNEDSVSDCVNGPADGRCGQRTGANPQKGAGTGDQTPDRQLSGPGDESEDNIPDLRPVQGYNRVGEELHDSTPDKLTSDWPSADRVGDGNPLTEDRNCHPSEVVFGECDANLANFPGDGGDDVRGFASDRVGRDGNAASRDRGTMTAGDGTPDRSLADILAGTDDPRKANRDGNRHGSNGVGVPDRVAVTNADGDSMGSNGDGVQDRNPTGDLRTSGKYNHSQPARDSFDRGPADRTKDAKSDRGGFGLAANSGGGGGGGGGGGAGGGGGCSLVPAAEIEFISAVSFLFVLLSPIALVRLRRVFRRN